MCDESTIKAQARQAGSDVSTNQILSLPHLLYEDNQERAMRAHARGCIPPLHLPPLARPSAINCRNTFSYVGSRRFQQLVDCASHSLNDIYIT